MARVRYEVARDVCKAVKAILESGVFEHIPSDKIYCVRSRGSRSTAIARIYGLPRAWIVALGSMPGYVIEVISERYDALPPERKLEVLVHELLHIPKTFSGGLRPHGRLVNDSAVRRVLRQLRRAGALERVLRLLEEP
ncbi:MAG: metallopeptidase [Desulfurococcales archaeon]|nr:metallopeptidase [Desulfurococcales archaeon]